MPIWVHGLDRSHCHTFFHPMISTTTNLVLHLSCNNKLLPTPATTNRQNPELFTKATSIYSKLDICTVEPTPRTRMNHQSVEYKSKSQLGEHETSHSRTTSRQPTAGQYICTNDLHQNIHMLQDRDASFPLFIMSYYDTHDT